MDTNTKLANRGLNLIADHLGCEPSQIPDSEIELHLEIFAACCKHRGGVTPAQVERYAQALRNAHRAAKGTSGDDHA